LLSFESHSKVDIHSHLFKQNRKKGPSEVQRVSLVYPVSGIRPSLFMKLLLMKAIRRKIDEVRKEERIGFKLLFRRKPMTKAAKERENKVR